MISMSGVKKLIIAVAVISVVCIILSLVVSKVFLAPAIFFAIFDITYAFMVGADETNKKTGGDED